MTNDLTSALAELDEKLTHLGPWVLIANISINYDASHRAREAVKEWMEAHPELGFAGAKVDVRPIEIPSHP